MKGKEVEEKARNFKYVAKTSKKNNPATCREFQRLSIWEKKLLAYRLDVIKPSTYSVCQYIC